MVKEREVGVVCGGGKIAREYRDAAIHFTEDSKSLDWVGISATKVNAGLVRVALGWNLFSDPNEAAKHFPHVVCSGWKPGRTTDYVSALLASLVGACVVNMTNVDYVYNKDPNKHEDAKPIEEMDWRHMIEICGGEHKPGINVPFAPAACKFAMEKDIKVIVLNGKDLNNLKSCLDGKTFQGTTIQ